MHASRRFLNVSAGLVIAACSTFAALPAHAADSLAGTYMVSGVTFAFDAHGHYRVSINNTTMVEGDYTVNGDQMQLSDTGGPWACTKAGEQTGSYRWKSAGDELSLSKIADSCEDRVQTLTQHAWKKQR